MARAVETAETSASSVGPKERKRRDTLWVVGLSGRLAAHLAEIDPFEVRSFASARELEALVPGPSLAILSGNEAQPGDMAALRGAPTLVIGARDAEHFAALRAAGVDEIMPHDSPPNLISERVAALLGGRRALATLCAERDALVRAQGLAQLGSWELDPVTLSMNWSDSLFDLLARSAEPRTRESGQLEKREASFDALVTALHPDDRDRFRRCISRTLHGGEEFALESRLHRAEEGPESTTRRVRQQGTRIPGVQAGMQIFGVVQDVTEQRSAEDRARRLADYDSLTGLANRRLFREELERAKTKAEARGQHLALLYLDVDRFKQINDSLGHAAGDLFLQHVADVLRRRVRRTDLVGRVEIGTPPATISRLGGDEFAILLGRIARAEDAGDVAGRILRALPRHISIEGHEISATGSVGISVYPQDGEDVETLIKHADTAMYAAKKRGRNTFAYFDPSMRQDATRKIRLEAEFRAALDRGELVLHYQPRVSLRERRVIAVEALVRWQHPSRGLLAPKDFLSVAEQAGLMVELGEFVLERACTEAKSWRTHGLELPVSVNVSPQQLEGGDLHKVVTDALQRTDLLPESLEIELTENLMLSEDENTSQTLRELQAIGVRIALDDFGTGYASLSSLSLIPLDILKLDRTLLRNVDADPAAAGIASAVIAMAHTLGLRVVAEGIDNPAQIDFLLEHQCEEAQGFLFSAALPSDDLVRFVSHGLGEKPWSA